MNALSDMQKRAELARQKEVRFAISVSQELMQAFRCEIATRLELKTGWGRNEVKQLVDDSMQAVLCDVAEKHGA